MGGLKPQWLAAVWPPVLGPALDESEDQHLNGREMVHRQLFPIKNRHNDVDEVLPSRKALLARSQLHPKFPPEPYCCLTKFTFPAIRRKDENPSYSSRRVKARNENI